MEYLVYKEETIRTCKIIADVFGETKDYFNSEAKNSTNEIEKLANAMIRNAFQQAELNLMVKIKELRTT